MAEHPLPSAPTGLLAELAAVIEKPDGWLDTGNTLFGGRAPRELIGTPGEYLISEVVQRLKHGDFS